MGTNRPGADLKDSRDNLIGIALGNHARDFQLTRAQDVLDSWRLADLADEQVPHAIHFNVKNQFLREAITP